MLEFKFPEDEEQFRTINNHGELKNKLQLTAYSLNMPCIFYRVTSLKMNYIYARCGKCRARIKYKKQGDSFRLMHFNVLHSHSLSSRTDNQIIRSFLESLPINMKTSNIKALTQNKFAINDRKFYYLFRSVTMRKIDFSQFISRLDLQKYQSRFQPFPLQPGVIPSLFITSSPSMRQNFLNYGQFMSVDVTYNLIKQRENGRNWGVCLLMGLNSHLHIIPFAIAIMNNQSEESFISLFLSFFDIMQSEPQTILSDQQLSIKSALLKLKQNGSWSGNHLLDQFHILKNLKKKFKKEHFLTLLKTAIYSQSEEQFNLCINQAKDAIQNEKQAKYLSDFIEKSISFAISRCPPSFIGVSINTSFAEKANDIIKSYVQYEKPAIQCLSKILKVMKIIQEQAKRYKICSNDYENLLNDSQIKLLRFTYCEKIFKMFIRYYIRSLSLLVDQISEDSWTFTDKKSHFYEARVRRVGNNYNCSCQIRQKKGIPCPHIISLLISHSEKYQLYFHERWKLDLKEKAIQNPHKCKMGRPRLSRKNRL